MTKTAAVLTISDKGYIGQRTDTSGPALVRFLLDRGWEVVYTTILPDEADMIEHALLECTDERRVALVLTTGGTGFSPRDITPEATLRVIERATPGIPEAMRHASMQVTPKGCLSRSVAGIRRNTLIINLPGSEKAAMENISFVMDAVDHGMEMLQSEGSANCGGQTGKVLAVCISERKGIQKHPVDAVELKPDWGIEGDAHAGNWHRQVSLLGIESVAKVQEKIAFQLKPGDFAENILTEGICLYTLPVGAKMRLGTALCEVTQIGKECHNNCAIREQAGDCVMPREGIFVKVLKPGVVKPGDTLCVYNA